MLPNSVCSLNSSCGVDVVVALFFFPSNLPRNQKWETFFFLLISSSDFICVHACIRCDVACFVIQVILGSSYKESTSFPAWTWTCKGLMSLLGQLPDHH